MTRVKRGFVARRKRKKILQRNKGFRGALSKLIRPAKQAWLHAMYNNYKDRKRKKREFRTLWIQRLNGALTKTDLTYSKFINLLTKKNIAINRKTLSELAINHKDIFDKVIEEAKK